jgi:hypothetical protein
MKKKALASWMFFLLVMGIFQFFNLVKANPSYVTVPDIVISSPLPQSVSKYVNSTVELEIYVRMEIDAPNITSIYYSLDEEPFVFLKNLTISTVFDFGIDKVDFTVYTARVDLESLSEGNHTVTAYVSPFLSTSRDFTVNSFVPVVEVLSPINQTYSEDVPLVFKVGGEVESAHYYMYRFKGFFDGNYAEVFENWFTKNITLESLHAGSYVMYLYATTSKGEALPATTYFSVSPSSLSRIDYLADPLFVAAPIMVIILVCAFGLIIYFKKRKH